MNKNSYLFTIGACVLLVLGGALGLSYRNGWKLSIGETASLFIASLAMLATTYQAWVTRRHNRLQVQPLIMLEYPQEARPTMDGTHLFGCRIHNVGLGPANVSAIKYTLDGKPVNAMELMESLLKDTGLDVLYQQHKINIENTASDVANGIYVREGQSFMLFVVKFWPEQTPGRATQNELSAVYLSAIEKVRKNLRIQTQYSSVYNEAPKRIDTDNIPAK